MSHDPYAGMSDGEAYATMDRNEALRELVKVKKELFELKRSIANTKSNENSAESVLPTPRHFWLNVYEHIMPSGTKVTTYGTYTSQEDAEAGKARGRVACIETVEAEALEEAQELAELQRMRLVACEEYARNGFPKEPMARQYQSMAFFAIGDLRAKLAAAERERDEWKRWYLNASETRAKFKSERDAARTELAQAVPDAERWRMWVKLMPPCETPHIGTPCSRYTLTLSGDLTIPEWVDAMLHAARARAEEDA